MSRLKAKYKIDSVVELNAVEATDIKAGFGRVNSITQNRDGFTYAVEGYASPIKEAWIVSAFNKSRARGTKPKPRIIARKTTVTAAPAAQKTATTRAPEVRAEAAE